MKWKLLAAIFFGGLAGYWMNSPSSPFSSHAAPPSIPGSPNSSAEPASAAGGLAPQPSPDALDRRGRLLTAILESERITPYDPGKFRGASRAISELELEDIPAALAIVRQRSSGVTNLLPEVIARWAEFDPVAAAAYIQTLIAENDWSSVMSARMAGAALAKKDPAAAKAWAEGMKNRKAQPAAVAGVAAGLLQVDPAGAIAWLQTLPGTARERDSYAQLYQAWAARDPREAGQNALRLSTGDERKEALQAIAYYWAGKDFSNALAWAQSIPEIGTRERVVREIFRKRSEAFPETVAEDLEALPPGALRLTVLSNMISGVAMQDLTVALRLVEQLPDPLARVNATLRAAQAASYRDPKEAATLLLTLPETVQGRAPALHEVMARWSQEAPSDVITFIQSNIPEGKPREEMRERAIANWSQSDPKATMEWLVQQGDNPARNMGSLFRNWAHRDAKNALDWARTRPEGRDRQMMEGDAFDAFAGQDPEGAAADWARLPKGDFRTSMAGAVTRGWTGRDPEGAAQWAVSLPDPAARDEAVTNLIRVWVELDSSQPVPWMEKLPPGGARDAAVSAYAGVVEKRDPAAAAAWAETIVDDYQRRIALSNLYRGWKASDAAAATEWLTKTTAVSTDEKAKWQK